jgi:hypothetical protein
LFVVPKISFWSNGFKEKVKGKEIAKNGVAFFLVKPHVPRFIHWFEVFDGLMMGKLAQMNLPIDRGKEF